jgi:hypothetical protein
MSFRPLHCQPDVNVYGISIDACTSWLLSCWLTLCGVVSVVPAPSYLVREAVRSRARPPLPALPLTLTTSWSLQDHVYRRGGDLQPSS